MMDRPTCKTCPYWYNAGDEDGECRKRAPITHAPPNLENANSTYYVVWWPTTWAKEWCGEHPDFPAYIAATRNPGNFSPSPALPRTDAAESVQSGSESPTIPDILINSDPM